MFPYVQETEMLALESEMDDFLMQQRVNDINCVHRLLLRWNFVCKLDKKNIVKIKFLLPVIISRSRITYVS